MESVELFLVLITDYVLWFLISSNLFYEYEKETYGPES